MSEPVTIQELNRQDQKQDCGCGCGGDQCGSAKQDCGCGCGGSSCGTVQQGLVFIGSVRSRDTNSQASNQGGCDGSCGCGGSG